MNPKFGVLAPSHWFRLALLLFNLPLRWWVAPGHLSKLWVVASSHHFPHPNPLLQNRHQSPLRSSACTSSCFCSWEYFCWIRLFNKPIDCWKRLPKHTYLDWNEICSSKIYLCIFDKSTKLIFGSEGIRLPIPCLDFLLCRPTLQSFRLQLWCECPPDFFSNGVDSSSWKKIRVLHVTLNYSHKTAQLWFKHQIRIEDEAVNTLYYH